MIGDQNNRPGLLNEIYDYPDATLSSPFQQLKIPLLIPEIRNLTHLLTLKVKK